MITSYAAILFAALAGFVVIFQIALVLGFPWGEFTLGGRWREALPVRVRLLPVFSIALLCLFSVIVFGHAGINVLVIWEQPNWAVWVVVAYCAIGVFANAATRSRRERMIWLPVVIVMLLSSLVVALS